MRSPSSFATRAGAFVALLLFSCSASDKSAPSPSATNGAAPQNVETLTTYVAHRDPRLDVPSFVWITRRDLPRFGSATEAASATMRGLASTFRLSREALGAVSAPVIHDLGKGAIVARFAQRVDGVEVFRGDLNLALNRSYEPIAATGLLSPSIQGHELPFTLDEMAALDRAHVAMTGASTSFSALGTSGNYMRFVARGLEQPARVKKVFFPSRRGAGHALVPAYYVEIVYARGGARSYVIAASDGRVLFDNDLVRNDSYTYKVWASNTSLVPADGPQGNDASPHPTGEPDSFKPTSGPGQLVTLQNFPFSKNDPWLDPGATKSHGNNVWAYADRSSPDGFAGANDLEADVSSPGVFDWTYDFGVQPGATPSNVKASATQMFYLMNFLHDWYYDDGFDEKSGNHQAKNFDRGGEDNDELYGEVQDSSGRNNADAMTPADGASPRIQMYLFSGPSNATLTVNAPAGVAGVKPTDIASFGKDAFDLTGSVVLADDGTPGDISDACEPLANVVTGKIVLVHRGLCSFVQKSQNVQTAGGIGIIVMNVSSSASPTLPPFMGGTSSAITIPALSLSIGDGQALEAAIGQGVTVAMHRALQTDLDGALDTSVAAHEWGHVLSNRLISNGNGLNSNQSGGLGEGWGDFSAMMVGVRADDLQSPHGANWAGAYINGGFAMEGTANFYFGTRRVPYSVDMTKDPLTFKHIANGTPLPDGVAISFGEDGGSNAEVHNTGEVWATMLWESYVSLLRAYPFSDAQARMKRYLVASLKLTPPDPTLLEARDAVLAAAFAADEKDYLLFWSAFARRGAGVGAVGPAKDSTTNLGVKESFVVGNDIEIVKATLRDDVISCDHDGILDEGEVGTLELTLRNAGAGTLSAAVAHLSSAASLKFPEGDGSVKLGELKPFESTTVKLKASLAGRDVNKAVALDIAIEDPTFVTTTTRHLSLPTRYDSDEAPNASASDTVDTTKTAWKVSGDETGNVKNWDRVKTDDNGYWTMSDDPEVADYILTSPKFTVAETTFGLSFKHRWSFRISTRRQVDVDGGVIEVSVDGGKAWKDASTYGKVDYNTTVDTGGRADNPLIGRPAYGNKNEGYPDKWVTTSLALTLPAPSDSVQVRFHAGSGAGFAGAPGWDIDDIALTGIATTPFYGFVAQQDACDPKGPTVEAAGPANALEQSRVTLVGIGTHPKELPLTYFWIQEAGPTAEMKGADTATMTFLAPHVTEPTKVSFALRAHDGSLLSPASRIDITVDPINTQFSAGGGCTCRTIESRTVDTSTLALSALALLFLRRRKPRR